jgi:hypothetical protein
MISGLIMMNLGLDLGYLPICTCRAHRQRQHHDARMGGVGEALAR